MEQVLISYEEDMIAHKTRATVTPFHRKHTNFCVEEPQAMLDRFNRYIVPAIMALLVFFATQFYNEVQTLQRDMIQVSVTLAKLESDIGWIKNATQDIKDTVIQKHP